MCQSSRQLRLPIACCIIFFWHHNIDIDHSSWFWHITLLIHLRHFEMAFFPGHCRHHWFQLRNKKVITWWKVSLGYRTLQFAAQLWAVTKFSKVPSLRQILSMQWVFHESVKLLSGTYPELYFASAKLNKVANKLWSTFPNDRKDPLITFMIMEFVITRLLNFRIIRE